MMKPRSSAFLAFPIFLCLFPCQVWGSIAPSSAGLSFGYSNDLGPGDTNWTPVPMLVATWRLADHILLRSSAAYLQERAPGLNRALSSSGYPSMPPGSGRGTLRNHIVPLAAGIRLSGGKGTGRAHGLFIEAAPAVYITKVNTTGGSSAPRLLAGFQVGWGMRVLAFDGTHFELGVVYYRSEGASPETMEVSRGYPGVDAAEIHLTVGLGR